MFDQQEETTFDLKTQELIGEGRYGEVYKTYSLKFGRYFSLKTIKKSKYSTDKPFYNEVSILRSFIHQNIVKIYGYFSTAEDYNIILQYCPKGTLRTTVKRFGVFDKVKFTNIFRQILSAIEYSHSNRICHCDIKPENILFDEYDRVQIADWGQASKVENEDGTVFHKCGTLAYSSPQCIQCKHFNGFKNDIYSVGVCMYFALCGEEPWTEKVPLFKKKQIVNNMYKPLPDYVDSELADLVYKLICEDECKRPDAKEILKMNVFNFESNVKKFCTKSNKKRRIDHLVI